MREERMDGGVRRQRGVAEEGNICSGWDFLL